MTSDPYRLVITKEAARALADRLPEKVATAVQEFITGPLLQSPYRVGKRLCLPPFEGSLAARRGGYRVLYDVDDDTRTVKVFAVDHRADAYRSR